MLRAQHFALIALPLLALACGDPNPPQQPKPDGGTPSQPETHTIGGTVTGLHGTLVLQNRGGDDVTLTMHGSFTFATSVAPGDPYAVTVNQQPIAQRCTVTHGSGTVANEDVSNVAVSCEDLDQWTFGPSTFVEAVSTESPSGFDPEIRGFLHRTSFPPLATLLVGSEWVASEYDYRFFSAIQLYLGTSTSLVGTYAIDPNDVTTGHASVDARVYDEQVGDYTLSCTALGGTLTVTQDDGPGGQVRANWTVTGWDDTDAPGKCPATPTEGSLVLTRDPDDLYGNDGTQTDHFTVSPNTYTEGDTVLFDPLAEGHHYNKGKTLTVTLRAGGNPDVVDGFLHLINVYLSLSPSGSTLGGTFETGTNATITYQSGINTCFASVAGNATATVEPYGDVGSRIDGTLTVNSWNNPTGSCPTTPWTEPFSVTREADK